MSKAMTNQPLHIISFDNPYPPNYGGVIDVFYKLKSLHELGFDIHLHCFYQDRNTVSDELKTITKSVHLYKKNRNPLFFFSSIPFGVKSRFCQSLVQNIKAVEAPVLFEGLQSTMLLHQTELTGKKYLRMHNLESNFYAGMSRSETNGLKKILYYFESRKYRKYERQLNQFEQVFTLSVYENEQVKTWVDNAVYLPVFHGNTKIKMLSEKGDYALYHGDLRLPDNKKTVQFLIRLFHKIPDYQLVIASSNGKDFVEQQLKNAGNITFVTIESEAHLESLLANAHINVLLSFQQSGTKLKLVNSLFKSRFCLINENMVDDKDILTLCELATTETDFIAKINELKNRPYLDNDKRNAVLARVLNDAKNAETLSRFITNQKA
ncbi:hypothetical protein EZL74_08055 [Flavobacterium silvisoli]|uniref:Glycosyltransferase family 1 protein n=1 Tax=Flavobacterium silvisoli TaxID=2529433 RepID=A0A4Q9YYJ3_9FLAO|nr:glycosyltransferase [Flavobacterium silvisoli]TBX68737.1 hypothetical protein EZL74_08055 [Flavobacterium silvisoli]